MPFVLDRRSFLKQSAGLAAGLAASWRLQGRANESSVKWALLSDTHVPADPTDTYRGFRSYDNAKKAFAQAADGKFDTVFVNGDVARLEGKADDYKNFLQLATPAVDKHPLAITLGNHDNRKNVRDAFHSLTGAPQPVQDKLVSVIDTETVRFILLDSLMATNHVPGLIGKAQRTWLADNLASANKPAVLFVHHNPGDTDSALLDTDRLLAILEPQRSVKALIFGHTHTYRFTKQGGLHLINLPAVGYNFADGEAVGWVEGNFSAKGAEFKLRAIAGETKDDGKITSVEWR